MAALSRLPSGSWRALVRRKGVLASRTFRLKSDSESWAIAAERSIDTGGAVNSPRIDRNTMFGDLIRLHLHDMAEVGKPPRRSKAYSLEKLDATLGRELLSSITRELLIEFGKQRRVDGAGPVTIGMEIGYIRTVLVHAAAVHGLAVPTEQVTLARVALNRLGLVGKGKERDRRPTQDELDRIMTYFDGNLRQTIPLRTR